MIWQFQQCEGRRNDWILLFRSEKQMQRAIDKEFLILATRIVAPLPSRARPLSTAFTVWGPLTKILNLRRVQEHLFCVDWMSPNHRQKHVGLDSSLHSISLLSSVGWQTPFVHRAEQRSVSIHVSPHGSRFCLWSESFYPRKISERRFTLSCLGKPLLLYML